MSTRQHLTALDIATAILEVTGDALMSGDFESFCSVFHVPQMMATLAGPVRMETREDMERAFNAMHSYFRNAGVNELRRESIDAKYISEDRIESTHVAETFCGDERITGPYVVFSVIERLDGVWKVSRSEYLLDATTGQAKAIAQADVSRRAQSS